MQKIDFKVDKRTELMSIILALSNGNDYVCEHFNFNVKDDYRIRAYNYFKSFKNHKCIQLANVVCEKVVGFNYDNTMLIAFELDDDFKFTKKSLSQNVMSELGDNELVKEFLRAVYDFANDTNFDSFYNNEREYYLSKINEVKTLFNVENIEDVMQQFFKMDINKSFCVNIIPMLINANHGFEIGDTIYANIGLLSEDFCVISNFDNGYKHIILHEFMHYFVNANVMKYKSNVKLNNKLANKDYQNDYSYIIDTIVRALTIMVRSKIDNINVQKFFDIEKRSGFAKVQNVYNEIVKFECQENNWNDYFANLLSCV